MEEQDQAPDQTIIEITTKNIEGLVQRVCRDETCVRAGKPQPIDNFTVHASSNKPFRYCKECMVKRRAAGQITRRKKEHKPLIKDAPSTAVTINFKDHPEVLKVIREEAKTRMREPEAQILYWLTKIADTLESRE